MLPRGTRVSSCMVVIVHGLPKNNNEVSLHKSPSFFVLNREWGEDERRKCIGLEFKMQPKTRWPNKGFSAHKGPLGALGPKEIKLMGFRSIENKWVVLAQ